MAPRIGNQYVTLVILAGCTAEPAGPSFIFEGTITSREPFVYGSVDTLPAMLVETHPGSAPDASCTNGAVFFLRDLKRLAFADGRVAGLAGLDDLAVGVRVRVWWDGSQLDSCPPKRRADAVTILS
jgi:hypothetical protein